MNAGAIPGLNEPLPKPVPASLPAATTLQQDLTYAGQRKVNLIWKWTQAIIAVVVTVASLTFVCLAAFLQLNGPLSMAALVFIIGLAHTIISNYFQRTNHTRIGGVGYKPYEFGGR